MNEREKFALLLTQRQFVAWRNIFESRQTELNWNNEHYNQCQERMDKVDMALEHIRETLEGLEE